MEYYCHRCGGYADTRQEKCKHCGLRKDVDQVILEITFWKSLNEQAKEKFIKIIERGLE